MYRNRNKIWTQEDLDMLANLVTNKVPMRYVCSALGRTQRAVEHALKNTMFQQLLYHDPQEIADFYNMKMTTLQEGIVSPKYYLPVSPAEYEDDTAEEAEEAEDAEDAYEEDDMANGEYESRDDVRGFIHGFALGFGVLLLGGAATYIHTLTENWRHLSDYAYFI